MQIRIIDRFDADFDDIARDSPQATFYHTSVWIESLVRVFSEMSFRCVIAEDGGRIVGYLPFFIIRRGPSRTVWSLPFGTYGGPATLPGSDVVGELVAKYASLRRGWGVREVGLVDFSSTMRRGVFAIEESSTHVLDLDGGIETVWEQRFDKSKRRQARRARREGLSIVEARAVTDVKDYYRIYDERSRRWGQRLRHPESLFVEVFARGNGNVRLFLARRGAELLGGHLNFYFRDTVIAWNGVTLDTGAGTHASTLLYSECIRDACARGFKRYNLGGSLGKSTLVGYKESLGAVACPYRTAIWRSMGGRFASALMRLLSRR